jgi:hypothetical protein
MKNRKSKAVLALGVLAAGVIAAGGAAFTNSTTLPTTTAGYGSTQISGAQANSVVYNTSPDGTKIESVTIKLISGTEANPIDYAAGRPDNAVYSIKGGFTRGTGPSEVVDGLTNCSVDGRDLPTNTNRVVCSFSTVPGTGIPTDSAMSFHLLVTNN